MCILSPRIFIQAMWCSKRVLESFWNLLQSGDGPSANKWKIKIFFGCQHFLATTLIFSIWRMKKKFQSQVGACLKKVISDPECCDLLCQRPLVSQEIGCRWSAFYQWLALSYLWFQEYSLFLMEYPLLNPKLLKIFPQSKDFENFFLIFDCF